MPRKVCLVVLVGMALTSRIAGISALSSDKSSTAEIPFEHVIIDSHAPLNQWAIGAGDINGDGQPDVVSSGEGPMEPGATGTRGGLYWYEYPAWTKHVIDAHGTFADDMQLVDVD